MTVKEYVEDYKAPEIGDLYYDRDLTAFSLIKEFLEKAFEDAEFEVVEDFIGEIPEDLPEGNCITDDGEVMTAFKDKQEIGELILSCRGGAYIFDGKVPAKNWSVHSTNIKAG